MQTCSNCQAQQFEGAIFCAECGASLLPARQKETTMSLGPRQPSEAFENIEPVSIPEPEPQQNGPSLVIVIMNSGRRIQLDLSEDMLIGRKDNARGIYPDVDLGLDGGYDAGVSRRHAILSHRNSNYCIEDLGSANGTFVNGKRISPQVATTLANSDEIKCGTLLMRVEF